LLVLAGGLPSIAMINPKAAELAESFTPRERLVVALRYCDDLTVAEIATVLDLPEDEVWRIHADVVRRVRLALAGRRPK